MTGHPEVASHKADLIAAVETPDRILDGNDGELIAVKKLENGKMMVVAYRQLEADAIGDSDKTPSGGAGFVITSFLSSRVRSLDKRKQIWPQQ